MKINIIAREKLVEKPIEWKEEYTEKTQFLKDQFTDVIGKGSYFRFEGRNVVTGDEYYCILSPARIHKPIAKFFAGVRKLPATYSAGGKYFDSFDSAAKYARETWGVPTPDALKPYTSAVLHRLGDRIDKWKERRDKKQEREDEKEVTEDVEKKQDMNTVSDIKNEGFSPMHKEQLINDESNDQLKVAFRSTIGNLIKIASELDSENNEEAAEEVHKVIRKYQERI